MSHLLKEERMFIESSLKNWKENDLTFQIIGDSLAKDPTTISKEIKLHRTVIEPKSFNNGYNQCAKKYSCQKRSICNYDCKFLCKECPYCNRYCKDFEKMICPALKVPPYVCNGCSSFSTCRFEKMMYIAETAQKEYEETQKDSKTGINMNIKEFKIYEETLKDGLAKGLSFEHIVNANPDKIPYSVRSVYNHLNQLQFSEVKNIDLRKKVKLKPRKKTQNELRKVRIAKIGHTYEDFLKYMEKHPDTTVVEMDTVIGKRDEPECLLTFMHRKTNMLMCRKLKEHTSNAVIEELDKMYETMGEKVFKQTFTIILTDNGSEFEDVHNIEYTKDGKQRCKVFYCDPMRSGQKGKLENVHRLVRYVIPKGTSLKSITEKDVILMYNNINNYIRKSLNHKAPIQFGKLLLNEKVISYFSLEELDPKKVLLNPTLLK